MRLAAALALALATTVPWVAAGATERIVTDQNTGLALYGIDPVAYFTDGKPLEGKPGCEMSYAGAIWRFRNEGNRAAFAANPDVYMPRFGGYDPVGVGRGVATPGYPSLFAVHDERLFLFYSEKARAAFLADPAAVIAAASARWSTVVSQLAN